MSALEKQLHLGRLPPRPSLPGGGGQSGSKMRMGPKLLCNTGVFSSTYAMTLYALISLSLYLLPMEFVFFSFSPGRKRDFSPVLWSQYFESMEDVVVENETGKDISFSSRLRPFYSYVVGKHATLKLRALQHELNSEMSLTVHTLFEFTKADWRALSYCCYTVEAILLFPGLYSLSKRSAIISRIQCRIVALDLRGHGETKVRNPEDLSAETMSKDVGNVVEALYGDLPPPIMLIGHSMGGAIAVHTAVANLVPSLLGLCMIDVVEGTAMDALNSMQNFLRSRPKTFKSLENAIEWSVKSGQIRNLESARVSMVGQVKQCEGAASPEGPKAIVEGIIEEEEEEEEDDEGGVSVNKRKKEDDTETKKEHLYTWRIELAKTEKYWDGWFRGLSNLFLSCPTPKLLLLAGVDRLDKDLTIGQMQGKFQMQVLPQCGHAVHEDAPDKVSSALRWSCTRHVECTRGSFNTSFNTTRTFWA
ncbi:hypothetical protein ASZ78_002388 [Callipepla squamata]|uniref:Protein phosphatase methylesterase 1 n=1 Tax=Callipepla squamata TaxID=9009 RepID=A0A226MH69_CALSU|nr:hypothetical protein ASZ78_002388 [Callipepla squamata]